MDSLLDQLERVSVEDIQRYPNNPRVGDVDAIAESLRINKQFMPLVVQRSTTYILAGNHTYDAARLLGWTEIDVVFIDVDDDKALQIVLAANRTADLGGYDEQILLNLLSDMREENEDLLEGTGYTTEQVDEMLADALAGDIDLGEEDSEAVSAAASILDRIMPGMTQENAESDVDDASSDTDKALQPPVQRKGFSAPSEFVLLRFGELRAKVSRQTYETFLTSWLKKHDGALAQAGVGLAIHLGIPEEDVQLALAEGAERWL